MKKMSTSSIRQLLIALMCIFGLSTAQAQYTVDVEQEPTTDYSNVGQEFKLSEIATALGTDTATLASQFAAATSAGGPFVAIDSTGTVKGYTGNPGEFWMNRYGQVMAYGNGCAFFIGVSVSAPDDVVRIYAGQYPNAFSKADTVTAKAAIVYGDKQVTFDITYRILNETQNPSNGVLSQLTLVGEQQVTIHQFPRSSYASDVVKVAVPGLAEQLGLTNEQLTKYFAKTPYAQRIDTYGLPTDTMSNEATANAPGFWFAKTIDRATGDYTNNLAAQVYGDSTRIYVQNLAINATCDTISGDLGQYPAHVHAGDSLLAPIYFVWGQKAYKVTYNLVVDQPTVTTLEDMIKVGERTDTIRGLFPNTQYTTVGVTYPIGQIAALLGCDSTAVSLQGLTSDNNLSTGSTANNGGYWMSAQGFVTSWGTGAAFFCEPTGMIDATHPNMSSMNVGLYVSGVNEGDTLRGSLYITNPDGTMYYQLNLVIPVEKQKVVETMEIVKTVKAAVQVIKSSTDYIHQGSNNIPDNQTNYYFTPDQANEILATTSPTLYSLYADSTWAADGTHKYNKSEFVCTPAPGFWLGKNGQAHGWSNNDEAPVGICWDATTGLFSIYQAPGATNAVGTSYNTSLFLVNEETAKAIQIDFTISWVDKLEQVTEVSSLTMKAPVSLIDTEVEFPIDSIAKALGVDVNTLMTSYSLRGRLANGLYSESVDPVGNGLMFNNDGSCNNDGGNIGINFSEDGTKMNTFANSDDDLSTGFTANATICFDVTAADGSVKRCVVNITFMNADDYATGVEGIKVNEKKANGRIYNLQGQQVSKPAHGVYIVNGRKVIFK